MFRVLSAGCNSCNGLYYRRQRSVQGLALQVVIAGDFRELNVPQRKP